MGREISVIVVSLKDLERQKRDKEKFDRDEIYDYMR